MEMVTRMASCKMETATFPGVKRPERGVNQPHKSSAKIKERVELEVYYTFELSRSVLG